MATLTHFVQKEKKSIFLGINCQNNYCFTSINLRQCYLDLRKWKKNQPKPCRFIFSTIHIHSKLQDFLSPPTLRWCWGKQLWGHCSEVSGSDPERCRVCSEDSKWELWVPRLTWLSFMYFHFKYLCLSPLERVHSFSREWACSAPVTLKGLYSKTVDKIDNKITYRKFPWFPLSRRK